MIAITKSETADTRTCDWSTVSKATLGAATMAHRFDVSKALEFCADRLCEIAEVHDDDKLTGLDHFHSDFKTGFKKTGWYENHKRVSRHHINKPEGVRADVNLLDVLEHVADCVMAGMARSGSVYTLELPDEVLQTAFKNTVDLLKSQVVVVDAECKHEEKDE